ncbi:acyltransferase domain-containing protein [Streptomyces brasiliscabiei]|uniref:acyltransferase domain-containing protein n=1 Tax=Streptomyces brasiliscabiei TaxID=2736302 RepID=UPI001C11AA2C|nr:acyltransferase domain-containing protein [Streptomyces brasiliscabiei]
MISRLPRPHPGPDDGPCPGRSHSHSHSHDSDFDPASGSGSGSHETPVVIVGLAALEGAAEAVRRAGGGGPVGRRVSWAADGVAAFFGDSVRGASQERLGALHLVWAALEDAGIVPGALRDSAAGVFLVAAEAGDGDGSEGLAALVGGDLGWGRGPRVTLGADLPVTAVDSAAEQLRQGRCEVAVAGSGTATVVVLRRESTAVRAGERVLAPVEAFGSDGQRATGGGQALPPVPPAPVVPIVLSGRSDAAVAALARDLLARLEADPGLSPVDLGGSLATTRTTGLGRRVVLLAAERTDVVRGLRAVAEGGSVPLLFRTEPGARAEGGGRAVFVFPGLGSQWRGMALDLLDASEVFRARMEECGRALEPLVAWSLDEVLHGAPGAPSLEDVDVVLPVLFAVSVSLSALWRSCGVEPAAVVGASLGEIAAAHVAGALTLEEAARVVVLWSRMQAEAAGAGELAAAALSPDELRPLLDAEQLRGRVHFAGSNGPRSVLFGGERTAVAEVVERLTARGVPATGLNLGLAAHTPGVAVDSAAFLSGTAAIVPTPAAVPFHSSVTGGEFGTTGLGGAYWLRNLASEVRFETAVRDLWAAGHDTFVEISPHPVLLGGVQETLEDAGAGPGAAASGVVGTLRRGQDGVTEWLTAMARLHVRGVDVDWAAFFRGRGGRRIALPTYPFGAEATDRAEGSAVGAEARAEAADGVPGRGTNPAAPGPDGLSLTGLTAGERAYAAEEFVRHHVAAVLRHDDPDSVALEDGFLQSGFDSLRAVELRNRLVGATGLPLPPTLIFDHPTPASVARLVEELLTAGSGPGPGRRAEAAVLDRLDALEDDLVASGLLHDGDDDPQRVPGRERVTARLRELLDRLAPGGEDEFGDVSLEELLDLADHELRRS